MSEKQQSEKWFFCIFDNFNLKSATYKNIFPELSLNLYMSRSFFFLNKW